MNIKKLLFICSQNKLRSPTAENVFSEYQKFDVRSAGLNNDAENVLSSEDIEWADYIFLMEGTHKNKLLKKFKKYIKNQKIIVLNIPDIYDYMDQRLIKILKEKVRKYLEFV